MTTPTDTARLREDLAWIARHPYNNRAKYTAVNSLPALLDEVDRLRAVAKFADHETVCRLNRRMGSADCTCGLDTARLALEPKP